MHHDLSLEFLPDWLPDETLFSLASRYHRLTGHIAGRHTSRILFGSSRSGYQHDFPSGIDHFVRVTNGRYGQSNQIIRTRTLLPYYLAFKDRTVASDALASMRSQRIGHLKYRLGILTSRARAHHPLKSCDECNREDRSRFGVGYWHLNHQFPGVLVCPRHDQLLRTSTLKSSGVLRFGYFLPDDAEAGFQDFRPPPSAETLSLLRSLGAISIRASQVGRRARIGLNAFRMACDIVFRKKGLLSENGRIRQKQASTEFTEFVIPVATLPEFEELPHEPRAASHMLTRLHSPSASAPHPMRFIAVIAWLFGSFERYEAIAKQLPANCETADRTESGPLLPHDASDKRQAFVERVKDGEAVSRAASRVGVDPAVGIGWAKLENISVTRRRKRIHWELLRQIHRRLTLGQTKQQISEELSVSVSSISRVLYSDPALATVWKVSRRNRDRDVRRQTWLRLISSHGHLGAKVLRGMEPATYAWLYRNDRSWLEDQRRKITNRLAQSTARVDWMERDYELEAELWEAIDLLANSEGAKQITIGRLCQLVPDLKRRLGQTDRLPRTRRLLERALKRGGPRNSSDPLPFA